MSQVVYAVNFLTLFEFYKYTIKRCLFIKMKRNPKMSSLFFFFFYTKKPSSNIAFQISIHGLKKKFVSLPDEETMSSFPIISFC